MPAARQVENSESIETHENAPTVEAGRKACLSPASNSRQPKHGEQEKQAK